MERGKGPPASQESNGQQQLMIPGTSHAVHILGDYLHGVLLCFQKC
jgi:hypothetical protein